MDTPTSPSNKFMKLNKYYELVYKAPIYYVFDCSQKKAKKLFQKEMGLKEKEANEMLEKTWGVGHSFAHYAKGNTVYGLWIENIENSEVLVHELIHLVRFIFNDRGVGITDNDEPFAYLVEHLYKQLI